MKALIPVGDAAEPVRHGEVREPRPAADEALLKVGAFSVNRGETFLLERPADGWRPGKDVAGLVVQAAADGSGPGVGRRAVGHPPAGGWAEYVAVATDALVELPDELPTTTAAALPLAGLTALRLLRVAGCVAGRRLLLTGASGGVGHYFVELAAAAGAEVTAVVATPERGERLWSLGAADVVVGGDPGDARGVFDVVLESVGGPGFARAVGRLAPAGTLIWFGQASREPATLDFFSVLSYQPSITIRHFHYLGPHGPIGDDLAALVRLVTCGRLHPEIGRTADWSDAAALIRDLRERRIRGNAVLTIDGNAARRTGRPHDDPRAEAEAGRKTARQVDEH